MGCDCVCSGETPGSTRTACLRLRRARMDNRTAADQLWSSWPDLSRRRRMSASISSAHWRSCSDIDRSWMKSARRRHWFARACMLASGSSSMASQGYRVAAPTAAQREPDGNSNKGHCARSIGDRRSQDRCLNSQRRRHQSAKANAAETIARTAASRSSDEKAIAAHMASAAG